MWGCSQVNYVLITVVVVALVVRVLASLLPCSRFPMGSRVMWECSGICYGVRPVGDVRDCSGLARGFSIVVFAVQPGSVWCSLCLVCSLLCVVGHSFGEGAREFTTVFTILYGLVG